MKEVVLIFGFINGNRRLGGRDEEEDCFFVCQWKVTGWSVSLVMGAKERVAVEKKKIFIRFDMFF